MRRAGTRTIQWLGAPFGPSQPRFVCRSLGLGFTAAALVGALSLLFPPAPGADLAVEIAAGGLAAVTGLVLMSGALDSAPPASFGIFVTWAILLASLAAYGAGKPVGGGELFFLWVVPYAFAFFSLRLAWLQTLLMAVAYAAVLLLQHHENPAGDRAGTLVGLWFLLIAAEVVVGVLVRRLGRSLRDVDQRFRNAFEHSPVGAAFLTPSGTFVEVNDALCALLARSRAELVGVSVQEVTHPDDRGTVEPGSLPARDLGGPMPDASGRPPDPPPRASGTTGPLPEGEVKLLRPDGTIVWVSHSGATITPEVGAPYRFSQYEDVSERRRAQDALSRRAIHDALTGLFNRTLLLERLEQAIARCSGAGCRPGVILLDLDQFKLVNDSLGHQVGDALLVELAPRLATAIRPGDTLARFGGDEFVVLCEDVRDADQAIARAEQLSAALRRPLELAGRRYVVSASIGVAVASGPEDSAARLLRDADAAMYRAKSGGRNRIVAFDESMREEARLRLELERALGLAVQRSEMSVVYQPIVDLDFGRPTAIEALVRWNHPERG
ncbi:MAG TPA: diguanylate cyclase, partial [Acidimicrobiales bacterium]|nr:diguanylate cyclase [Acidimicrobiales bacterium]